MAAEDLADGLGEGFAAVEDEQHAFAGVEAPVPQSADQTRTTAAFSVELSTTPRGTLVPSAVTSRAPTMVWPAKSKPSMKQISHR